MSRAVVPLGNTTEEHLAAHRVCFLSGYLSVVAQVPFKQYSERRKQFHLLDSL